MTQIRVKTQNMAKKVRAYLKKSWILQEELNTITYSQQEYEQEQNDLVTRDQALQHARITANLIQQQKYATKQPIAFTHYGIL